MEPPEAGGTEVPPASASPEDSAEDNAEDGAADAGTTLRDAAYDAIEEAVLGRGRHYTKAEVAELTGVELPRLTTLWRALGFPSTGDDEAHFVEADLRAIAHLMSLLDSGLIAAEDEAATARTMGRTFARLADWEVSQLSPHLGALLDPESSVRADDAALLAISGLVTDLLPRIQELQDYVWRRHLTSAAGRALLHADGSGTDLAVGFADIVGFTRTSRNLTSAELGALVEHFEAVATEIIAESGGRVIKTIGDEVLFVCDDPAAAARIALGLAHRHAEEEAFPEVRVGLAHGPVLARLGDVFGEVVNTAARLTSLARPATVLVNRDLADLLADDPSAGFRLRKAPTERVRGYSRLETWALKPAD